MIDFREIHKYIKKGYDEYSIYFWAISISAILSSFLGVVGVFAFLFTLYIFYWLRQISY